MISPLIFRNYDVRGIYPRLVNSLSMYKIGFHFAQQHITLEQNSVIVAHDNRNSSPKLYHTLIAGLEDGGAKALPLGLTATPALYYADKLYQPAASFMITASHNPMEENGVKILKQGKAFFGKKLQQLYHTVVTSDTSHPSISIATDDYDISDQYINHILRATPNPISPHLKCIWDVSNSAAAPIVKKLIRKLPNHNQLINCDLSHSSYAANPLDNSRQEDMRAAMQKYDADLVIAFDSDADRLCVMKKDGTMVHGDQLLALFSRDLMQKSPHSPVIADVKTSISIRRYIQDNRGNLIISKTGHPWIKEKILLNNALLAGEYSGHFFFADNYYGYDDGIYAALRLLALISKTKQSLEELIADLPIVHATPELNIPILPNQQSQLISQLYHLVAMDNKHQNIDLIDGIEVLYPNGWWLARLSNTSNSLVMRVEGSTKKDLQQILNLLSHYLKHFALELEYEPQ